jgi:hypothetical protein
MVTYIINNSINDVIDWMKQYMTKDVIARIKKHVIWFALWLHLNETLYIKNVYNHKNTFFVFFGICKKYT